MQFFKDVGSRPSAKHSLDRWPNPAGNYEPTNVRWATPKEQGRNLRDTRYYTFEGALFTLGELSERVGIPHERLYARIEKYGWSVTEAIRRRNEDEPVTVDDLRGRWHAMIDRCHDPMHPRYVDYGGRGIHVCARWRQSFEDFVVDVGLPSSANYTLDRYPNNNGCYEPGNVLWRTYTEQTRNRRSTKLMTLNGQTKPLAVWTELAGMPYGTVKNRLHRGWSLEEALGTPVGNMGRTPNDARKRWVP